MSLMNPTLVVASSAICFCKQQRSCTIWPSNPWCVADRENVNVVACLRLLFVDCLFRLARMFVKLSVDAFFLVLRSMRSSLGHVKPVVPALNAVVMWEFCIRSGSNLIVPMIRKELHDKWRDLTGLGFQMLQSTSLLYIRRISTSGFGIVTFFFLRVERSKS
ncbi:hypothetical protein KC19_1G050500 [Ceratodon purpureus]|uniref:Uncharacterized protein n=1 Tax=Ceratodon purpureus TaxID=3225 RepID=A0A8T0J2R9_CERPU|nr:hypothetical protein KC19_1G050500 [Ceratodon purpureus]